MSLLETYVNFLIVLLLWSQLREQLVSGFPKPPLGGKTQQFNNVHILWKTVTITKSILCIIEYITNTNKLYNFYIIKMTS